MIHVGGTRHFTAPSNSGITLGVVVIRRIFLVLIVYFYDMVDLHRLLVFFSWCRYAAAADQGCTKSLCNLGVIYIKGAENIPKNDVLAVKYLKKGNFPPHTSLKLLHIALKMPQLLVLEIS